MVNSLLLEKSCSPLLITSHVTLLSIENVNIDTFNMHRIIFFIKTNCSHCLHCFEEGNFQTFDMPDVLTSGNDTYNGLMRGWNHQRNVFVKILFLPRTAKLQFPELHVRIKTCRFLTVDTATIERTLAY